MRKQVMRVSVVVGTVVCVAIAALAGWIAGRPGPGPDRAAARHPVAHGVRTSSAAPVRPDLGAPRLPTDPRLLAAAINRAQQVIDDPASTSPELAGAGLSEQLATGVLGRDSARARRITLGRLRGQAAATMRTNLVAEASLSRITPPEQHFPPWTIIQPPAPGILSGYFREAQSRFGIRWQYLAAIELIETRFGRIRGPSSAGAQGPMQFLPSTWARFGTGNIDNQRDAILAAARYLVANGAPGDMPVALYHYNPSNDYVTAVLDYAGRMRVDPRAYYGYYNWQVIFARVRGAFILPQGYPRVRPVRVHYP